MPVLNWMQGHVFFVPVFLFASLLLLVVFIVLPVVLQVTSADYIPKRECVDYQIVEKDMGQGLGPARYAMYAAETCFVQSARDEVWYQRSGGQWVRVGVE